MSKVYFCKKLNSEFIQCGESDPDKFQKGRYSICKNCQKMEIYELRRKKKELSELEELKKDDTESKIEKVVKRTLVKSPLIEGKSATDILSKSFKEISEISETSHVFKVKKDGLNQNFQILNSSINETKENYSKITSYCKQLEENDKILKNQIEDLKNIISRLEGRINFLEKMNKKDYVDKLKK
jgi:hypothetical protein